MMKETKDTCRIEFIKNLTGKPKEIFEALCQYTLDQDLAYEYMNALEYFYGEEYQNEPMEEIQRMFETIQSRIKELND